MGKSRLFVLRNQAFTAYLRKRKPPAGGPAAERGSVCKAEARRAGLQRKTRRVSPSGLQVELLMECSWACLAGGCKGLCFRCALATGAELFQQFVLLLEFLAGFFAGGDKGEAEHVGNLALNGEECLDAGGVAVDRHQLVDLAE